MYGTSTFSLEAAMLATHAALDFPEFRVYALAHVFSGRWAHIRRSRKTDFFS
ncbi:MAG: hypothetical protein R2941_06375 [Desulfobacterales bacterium]